jgi:hypothetical protein
MPGKDTPPPGVSQTALGAPGQPIGPPPGMNRHCGKATQLMQVTPSGRGVPSPQVPSGSTGPVPMGSSMFGHQSSCSTGSMEIPRRQMLKSNSNWRWNAYQRWLRPGGGVLPPTLPKQLCQFVCIVRMFCEPGAAVMDVQSVGHEHGGVRVVLSTHVIGTLASSPSTYTQHVCDRAA